MKIPLKNLYYLGMGIYIFSFFLPVYSSTGSEPYFGYQVAFMMLGGFLQWESLRGYLFMIFLNLSNLVMVLNMILQFKFKLRQLFFLQCLGLLSSLYWIFPSPFSFKVGYWNWMFGILLVTLIMLVDYYNHKKQRNSSPDVLKTP